MYDLSNRYDNTLSVMQYTIAAMRDVGFTQGEIEDYIDEATKSHNAHLVDVSIEYVNKCNERVGSYNDDYYPWDDYNDQIDNDDFTYSKQWGFDNYDDSYDNDDFEGYEGFSGHSNKYYWENEDLDF